MACSFKSWSNSSISKSRRFAWSKLIRLRCTENHVVASDGARDLTVKKSKPPEPQITQRRIKNELSYHLPTVPLPLKLENSVQEVLKRECIIRVFVAL